MAGLRGWGCIPVTHSGEVGAGCSCYLAPTPVLCPRHRNGMAICTRDSTCEQWLVARGQVLGYPGVVLVVIAVVVPLLDPSNVAINTHYPPCEQWLAAVVVGALLFHCGGVVDRL